MLHLHQLFRVSATVLVLTALVGVSACAQQDPGDSASPTANKPTTQAATTIDLTIAVSDAPGAAPRTYTLRVSGSTPDAESTVPDPAAALSAVEQYGEKQFFPVPDPNRVCTQQFGGPQVAVVTGWFKGKEVNTTFQRTDGCEISRWQAMAPLFGALAGGTGAI